LKEEEARAIINAGYGICPRCDGKLSIYIQRKFFTKVSSLYCPSCKAFWEDVFSLHKEMEQASIETLKRKGLSEPWPFEVPILLGKDEIAYLVLGGENIKVSFYEGRKYTYHSSSMGVSLRVTKGVWLHPRVGSGSVQSEDVLELMDTGKLVLTNKRLIFVGNKISISTELEKLISVETDADIGQDGFLYIAKQGKQRIEAYLIRMPNLIREFILLDHEKNVLQK